MRGTNQGGSLAGFIIIGVLLTLVLVGGLYGLNRYNAQKASDEVASKEEAAKQEAERSQDPQAAPNGSEQAGRERTKDPIEESQTQTQPQSQTQSSSATTQASLPQTGPADSLAMFAVLGLATFAGVHFVQSRTRP